MRSSSNPQRSPAFVLLTLLGLAAAACDGRSAYRSPTAPEVPATPATPAPPPPAVDLTGAWAGTVTVTWDEMDGGGSCSLPVIATFTQNGPAVSGSLTGPSTSCIQDNQFRFEGALEEIDLVGTFVFPEFTWPAFGRVSETGLTVSAFNVRWELRR